MITVHDIAFSDRDGSQPDMEISGGDLVGERGLETAVLISLFTDRFVPTEELPSWENRNHGWWADALSQVSGDRIGSRLWTLMRDSVNDALARKVEDVCYESLQWMIEDGVARSIKVEASVGGRERIDFSISIEDPNEKNSRFRFVWDGQEFRFSPAASTVEDQEQRVSFSSVPDAGTFTLKLGTKTSAALNYDDTATEIQAALRAATGYGTALSVSGNFTSGFTITFSGIIKALPLFVVSSNALTSSGTGIAVNVEEL